MKKSKVLLLSLGMALCVGGGIGAAVAISKNPASSSGTGNFDKAVCLYWGHGESSVTLENMQDLTANVAQYRFLTVSPYASSAAGNVKLSFELKEATINSTKTAVLKGLTVSVFKTESLATKDTVADLIKSVTPEPVLTPTNKTGSTEFAVSQGETTSYYAIQVIYDGTQIGETEQLAGILDISQSFVIGA